MTLLRFEGFSDDSFGEIAEFDIAYDCFAGGQPVVFEVKSGSEGLLVWGQYAGADWPPWSPPCWLIGTQLLDDGASMPTWHITFDEGGGAHSHALLIEAPDDVRIRCLNASH